MTAMLEYKWQTPALWARAHAWPRQTGTFRLRCDENNQWNAFNVMRHSGGDRSISPLGMFASVREFKAFVARQGNWEFV